MIGALQTSVGRMVEDLEGTTRRLRRRRSAPSSAHWPTTATATASRGGADRPRKGTDRASWPVPYPTPRASPTASRAASIGPHTRAPTAAEKKAAWPRAPSDSTSLLDRVARRPQSDRTSATTAAEKSALTRPHPDPRHGPRNGHDSVTKPPRSDPTRVHGNAHGSVTKPPRSDPTPVHGNDHDSVTTQPCPTLHTGQRKRPRRRHEATLIGPTTRVSDARQMDVLSRPKPRPGICAVRP